MTVPQPLARNSKIHIKTNSWQQMCLQSHQSLSHGVNRTLRRDNPTWISTGVCAWHQLIILSQRWDGLPRNSAASAQDGQFLAVNVCRMRWVTRECVHQQNCQGVTHGNVGKSGCECSVILLHSAWWHTEGKYPGVKGLQERNLIYAVSSWMWNSDTTRALWRTTKDLFGKQEFPLERLVYTVLSTQTASHCLYPGTLLWEVKWGEGTSGARA